MYKKLIIGGMLLALSVAGCSKHASMAKTSPVKEKPVAATAMREKNNSPTRPNESKPITPVNGKANGSERTATPNSTNATK